MWLERVGLGIIGRLGGLRIDKKEFEAKMKNINLEYMKPVTTFGYDSVLFIDDNKIEELRVQILFEIANGRLDRNVTFCRGEKGLEEMVQKRRIMGVS